MVVIIVHWYNLISICEVWSATESLRSAVKGVPDLGTFLVVQLREGVYLRFVSSHTMLHDAEQQCTPSKSLHLGNGAQSLSKVGWWLGWSGVVVGMVCGVVSGMRGIEWCDGWWSASGVREAPRLWVE